MLQSYLILKWHAIINKAVYGCNQILIIIRKTFFYTKTRLVIEFIANDYVTEQSLYDI